MSCLNYFYPSLWCTIFCSTSLHSWPTWFNWIHIGRIHWSKKTLTLAISKTRCWYLWLWARALSFWTIVWGRSIIQFWAKGRIFGVRILVLYRKQSSLPLDLSRVNLPVCRVHHQAGLFPGSYRKSICRRPIWNSQLSWIIGSNSRFHNSIKVSASRVSAAVSEN